MMTATAESPRAADALHKIAAAAAARSTAGDENAPANGNSKPSVKKLKETEPKQQQQSESDDANDDDENDEEEDDDEEADVKPNKTSRKSSKTSANTNSDDDKKASKKSRRELPPHTVAILKGWMLSPEHVKHPYPTDEDKQMLLKKTGINMKQLTNWFTNARKRIWKPMMRREHSRQLQSAIEFEKTRGGPAAPPYPMAPPMAYGERPAYPPRQAIRHSFDAGSLGGPPRDPTMMGYAQPPPPHPYDVPPPAYPGVPSPHHGAAAYPPRAVRSVSESATRHDMDDYIDAMRIRKRVHDMAPDGTGEEHPDKRFRRATNVLSPRCLQILHEWVATHRHMEYPTPNDSDKLQLSRDTGLDVQQIELWFKTNVGRFGALLQPAAMPQMPPHPASYQQQRSIPSRDNPMYPPPPAYGERRSIPSQGNPMFPPRPAARSSIPGAGNPQFPPPPAVRRDGSEGYARPPPGYPPSGASGAPMYPPPPHQGYDAANTTPRPMRTMSVNSGQYPQPPSGAPSVMPPMPTPVGAPGSVGLPSLTWRPLPVRQGPPMGQARDARSHTLDMGQFADARRRKMNFQDILASTSGPMPAPMPMRPVAEPLYPTEVAAPYAQKQGFEPPSNGATEAPVAGSTSTSSSSRI